MTDISAVIEFVRAQYADPNISVLELSRTYGICSRHLGRLFKRTTGKTFRCYLRDLRVCEAARLLTTSTYEIKMIASFVGYRDRSHFGEDFRFVTGYTPAEYRLRHRTQESVKTATLSH
ncbi:MAG TPA: AraC family transcriptional regulator [Bryobacteraceae bacterium]|nr:AraC family transcriptional regulator [Bryobacteraceae bacterium]